MTDQSCKQERVAYKDFYAGYHTEAKPETQLPTKIGNQIYKLKPIDI